MIEAAVPEGDIQFVSKGREVEVFLPALDHKVTGIVKRQAIVATAMADIPSSRPRNPIFPFVVALIPTCPAEIPNASEICSFIAVACGKIFGASGGVMEAAVRTAHYLLTGEDMKDPKLAVLRGLKGRKEAHVTIKGIDGHGGEMLIVWRSCGFTHWVSSLLRMSRFPLLSGLVPANVH